MFVSSKCKYQYKYYVDRSRTIHPEENEQSSKDYTITKTLLSIQMISVSQKLTLLFGEKNREKNFNMMELLISNGLINVSKISISQKVEMS